MKQTITTASEHGMQAGVAIRTATSRGRELLRLFRNPRVVVVVDVTPTSFTVETRRMNWREWRTTLWRVVTLR